MSWFKRMFGSPVDPQPTSDDTVFGSKPPIILERPPKHASIKIPTERVQLIQVLWITNATTSRDQQWFSETAGQLAEFYLGDLFSRIAKHKVAKFQSLLLQDDEVQRAMGDGIDQGWTVFVLRRTCRTNAPSGQVEMDVQIHVMVDRGQQNRFVEVRTDNTLVAEHP